MKIPISFRNIPRGGGQQILANRRFPCRAQSNVDNFAIVVYISLYILENFDLFSLK